mgnify:CR=1 FL=1
MDVGVNSLLGGVVAELFHAAIAGGKGNRFKMLKGKAG